MIKDQALNFKVYDAMLRDFNESIRPKDERIRKKVDMCYRWDGRQAILFEISPDFRDPKRMMERAFAKIRYIKSKDLWKLYWMRASGNWESYEPNPEASELSPLLEVIKKDKYGCFFG